MRVAVSEKGHRIGQDHYNARLTDGEVDLIFELHESGMGYGSIASVMECSKSTVRSILKGQRRCSTAARFKTVHVSEDEGL